MVNDPIGDMLIQIKNAALARRRNIGLPHSKAKFALANILKNEGYLSGVDTKQEDGRPVLMLELAYDNPATPVLSGVRRISKPGLRRYVGKREIPWVMGGMGVAILSTPKGMMSGGEAKKQGLGGEFICEIW